MCRLFTNFLPYIPIACLQVTAGLTILPAPKNGLFEERDIPNITFLINAAISVVAQIWEWPGGDPMTNLPIKYRTDGTNAAAGVIPGKMNKHIIIFNKNIVRKMQMCRIGSILSTCRIHSKATPSHLQLFLKTPIPYQCNFVPVQFACSWSVPGSFVEFFTRNVTLFCLASINYPEFFFTIH